MVKKIRNVNYIWLNPVVYTVLGIEVKGYSQYHTLLLAFLDLDDLPCQQTMSFAVNGFSGFFARSVDQAKDRPAGFIEPVLQVLNAIFALNFQVSRVRTRDRFFSSAASLLGASIRQKTVPLALSNQYFR